MPSRMLTGKTKVCGVIGDPIEHSMSPAIHNTAYAEMGLDYLYVPFRVRPEALPQAIGGMRALNIVGLNVTIPHKVAVIPLLDRLEPLAEKIGAVNTIAHEDGVLTGYNTDASGFLQALLAAGTEPRGKSVVVLGAGGAARAVAFALAERGARLTIINRTLDKAMECADNIARSLKAEVSAARLDGASLETALAGAEILVNAASVGMYPATGETPVPARLLRPGLVVFDTVYHPIRTRLLEEAGAAGAKAIDGVDMLVRQAALAIRLWTGREAPLELMRATAIKRLKQDED